eukprot:2577772-Amphidinium_carterae.1
MRPKIHIVARRVPLTLGELLDASNHVQAVDDNAALAIKNIHANVAAEFPLDDAARQQKLGNGARHHQPQMLSRGIKIALSSQLWYEMKIGVPASNSQLYRLVLVCNWNPGDLVSIMESRTGQV